MSVQLEEEHFLFGSLLLWGESVVLHLAHQNLGVLPSLRLNSLDSGQGIFDRLLDLIREISSLKRCSFRISIFPMDRLETLFPVYVPVLEVSHFLSIYQEQSSDASFSEDRSKSLNFLEIAAHKAILALMNLNWVQNSHLSDQSLFAVKMQRNLRLERRERDVFWL